MTQAGVSDLGAVERQECKFGEAREMCQTGVGDRREVERQVFKFLEALEVDQAGVGDRRVVEQHFCNLTGRVVFEQAGRKGLFLSNSILPPSFSIASIAALRLCTSFRSCANHASPMQIRNTSTPSDFRLNWNQRRLGFGLGGATVMLT